MTVFDRRGKFVVDLDTFDSTSKKKDININKDVNKDVNEDADRSLSCTWVLWTHSLASNDWSLDGYNPIIEINTVSEFWKVFNNFDKLGADCFHMYLMRKGITPMWEDKQNRNGGVCSIKIDFEKSIKEFEELCSYLVTDNLTENVSDCDNITGVSFSPKINSRFSFSIIKIWNNDSSKDIMNELNKKLNKKYSKYNPQYKANAPEY